MTPCFCWASIWYERPRCGEKPVPGERGEEVAAWLGEVKPWLVVSASGTAAPGPKLEGLRSSRTWKCSGAIGAAGLYAGGAASFGFLLASVAGSLGIGGNRGATPVLELPDLRE